MATNSGPQSSTKLEATADPEGLLVGIIVDGNQVGWGECRRAAAGEPEDPLSYLHPALAQTAIKELVEPALQGQTLSNLAQLSAKLDRLVETVTVTKVRRQPQPAKRPRTLSRRDLFTGRLGPGDRSPGVGAEEAITVERPLHPAVRYGVTRALLEAWSRTQGQTITEVLAQEFGLPIPEAAVPIHTELQGPGLPAHGRQAASLGYTLDRHNVEAGLGEEGKGLQGFTRQLARHISEALGPEARPTIHLDVGGGLGRLYENNMGKVLGALYGLQQAAAPYPLRVQDPLILESRPEQIEALEQLKDYVRLRNMSLQLVAGAWIHSLEAIREFLRAQAVHAIRLEASRLGSIGHVVAAVKACRNHQVGPLLVGAPAGFAAHVALATQPDWVTVPATSDPVAGLVALHNEMARTLAWLSHRS